jgi:hypothetical protein
MTEDRCHSRVIWIIAEIIRILKAYYDRVINWEEERISSVSCNLFATSLNRIDSADSE